MKLFPLIIIVLTGLAVSLGHAADEKAPAPTTPPALVYENNFETDDALSGWLPLGGTWGLASDETSVLRQTQRTFRGLARLVRLAANYEVNATVRPLTFSGQWGSGLVAYWQPQEGCYRLSNFGGVLALWRETGDSAEALAALRMEFKSQAYRMRLSVQNEARTTQDEARTTQNEARTTQNEAQATVLRAKVWPLGEREPEGWQITAQDLNRPLRFGRAGLFTGRASAVFSEFAVTPLTAGASPSAALRVGDGTSAPTPAPLNLGNTWHFIGGEWQSTGGTLRQNLAGSALGFRAAAYALAAGWGNHTVQVSVKADSGSRNQGFGLSAHWMDDGDQYQLGQMNGMTLFLGRRSAGADLQQLQAVPFAFKQGVWYMLKLQLSNEKTGVRLRGKAWPARAGEPTQWQIEALDEATPRLLGGEIGVWCIDDVCSFDDLQVMAP